MGFCRYVNRIACSRSAALLSLEDSELGAVMREHLNGLPSNGARKFTFASLFREDCLARYPRDLQGQASKCLAEGWMWLQREGLIAQDPDDNYAMWYFVTRRGSLAHLCAGAIGSYKNPHSHRNVAIDAREAVEMLIVASLFRIAEERAAKSDA